MVDSHETSDASGESAEPAPSWKVAAGEVLLAVALGTGLSYGFRVLWRWQPYVAAVAAPICICLAVGLVGIIRARRGYPMMPFAVLLLILFVLTVLVTLPAAWVMAAPQ